MLVPEAFQTDETRERFREANVSVQVAGQGLSAGGSGATSGSTSQQVSCGTSLRLECIVYGRCVGASTV